MIWFEKSFFVGTGHVQGKIGLASLCVLHAAGLKIVSLWEDILPVLNIDLLKSDWSGWRSPKLKIKAHRVGKFCK